MAERGRDVLLGAHPQAHPAPQLPLARRLAGRHQPLPRRAQCRSQAVRLDRIPSRDPRQARQAARTIRMSQSTLEAFRDAKSDSISLNTFSILFALRLAALK